MKKRMLAIVLTLSLVLPSFPVLTVRAEDTVVTSAETEIVSEDENQVKFQVEAEPSQTAENVVEPLAEQNERSTVVLTPLATPKINVTRDAKGIHVVWKKINGAESYQIDRKITQHGTWKTLGTVTDASYLDNKIACGKTYYYRVKALTTAATATESAFSAEVRNYVNTIYKPANVSASSTTSSITLTWSDVLTATGYEVYRSTSNKTGTFYKVKTTSATSCKDTSVKSGYTYYYKIRAVAGAKKGAFSTVASARVKIATPTVMTGHYSTKDTITVRWNKVSAASGYYVYRRKSINDDWIRIKNIKGNGTLSYKDTGLSGKYYYSVKAYVTVNKTNVLSGRSKSIRLSTLASTKLTVKQVGSEAKMQIKWNALSGATSYRIYKKKGSSTTWEYVKTTTETSYTCKVSRGIDYSWRVRPIYTNSGISTWGSYSTIGSLKLNYDPDFQVIMLTEDDYNAPGLVLCIINNGSKTMRVYSRNAYFDSDLGSMWDETLYMRDANNSSYPLISYVDIKPGKSETLLYTISDLYSYMYYTTGGLFYYDFRYDGIDYRACSSGQGYNYFWVK